MTQQPGRRLLARLQFMADSVSMTYILEWSNNFATSMLDDLYHIYYYDAGNMCTVLSFNNECIASDLNIDDLKRLAQEHCDDAWIHTAWNNVTSKPVLQCAADVIDSSPAKIF
jgi:hypothetical protein